LQEVPIKPPSATASVFLFYWQCFMSVLLLLFLLSCVAEFAQVRFNYLYACMACAADIQACLSTSLLRTKNSSTN